MDIEAIKYYATAKVQSEHHFNLNEPAEGCLFCKIIKGEISSTMVYEDELVYAFKDIAPQAPVHILVIPKVHISSIDAIGDNEAYPFLISRLLAEIPQIAKAQGITEGYRVISNVGEHGAQSVKHLHFHILGGKQLSGNMG